MNSPTGADMLHEIDKALMITRKEIARYETPYGFYHVKDQEDSDRLYFLQAVFRGVSALQERLRSQEFADEISRKSKENTKNDR